MGKVKGKHRLDKFYRLAKESGFRSRASYKLLQLDSKYNFLHSSTTVLDLCAAPGGWMQVAVKKAPVGSFILGIDLVPISPIRGCVSIQQDITKIDQCGSKIKQVMEKHGLVNVAFDLVLHDGSPNIGGAWDQEAMCQNALVIDSLKLATEFLAPRGNFITKVFRSRDYNSVLFCLGKLFDKVEVFKPLASRLQSAETYLLGLGYKAPAKIDPRLLDIRHLFKEVEEPKRKVLEPKQKRQRERGGYDNESILRNVASAHAFIWCENPLEILGTFTCISFDDDQASLPLKEHDLTTKEIQILCQDLLVLGKNDFKEILKWRVQIKKALTREKKESAKKELELVNELEKLTNTLDSDEEVQRYTDQVEKILDDTYDRYLMMKKQGNCDTKEGKRVKHSFALEDDRVDEVKFNHHDSDTNGEENDEATNPLVVPLDDDHDGETTISKEEASPVQSIGHSKTLDQSWNDFEIVPTGLVTEDDFEIIPTPATEEDDFVIVPTPATDSDSDSSSDDDDNVHTKAEILDSSKKMQRKKMRQEMLGYAYNKHMFKEEEEGLGLLLFKRFLEQKEQAMKKKSKRVDRKMGVFGS